VLWPSWYVNSKSVCFLSGPPPDLAAGTRFRWWTFGATIVSTVREFLPLEGRIAWDGHAFGVHVYHAWLIRPTPDGGCHILTEERQRGFLSRLNAIARPTKMSDYHQLWLEKLRDNAASGMPWPVKVLPVPNTSERQSAPTEGPTGGDSRLEIQASACPSL
jgi:hypothetical protein